jgi:hypothetical protein
MSSDEDAIQESWTSIVIDKPYDQILLFGDSITEQSGCQERGFAFAPALQDGNNLYLHLTIERDPVELVMVDARLPACSSAACDMTSNSPFLFESSNFAIKDCVISSC